MQETIEVKVLNTSCAAGDEYAKRHLGATPKAAVLSCEGACLKGEVARRAANVVAHELVPNEAARICHGGALLLKRGGMRNIVSIAEKVIVVEGCPMACGTRLVKAAFPEKTLEVVVANTMYECDGKLFGVNEMEDDEIQSHAQTVAGRIVSELLRECPSPHAEASTAQPCGCSG